MNKETKIATVLMVFTIIFTLIGSSFAYWVYRANITTVSFTVTKSFECSGDMGGVISTNELAPASCTHSRYAIQREVTVDPVIYAPGVSIYMDLWLNVDQVDAGLAASNNFKYALTRTANSCTDDVISTGTFRGKNKVNILEAEPFSYVNGMPSRPNLSTTYYLYVWLDAAESNIATQNNNFTLSLGGQCTQGEYVGGEYTPSTGAELLISKANGPTVTTYSEGDTGEMYTFSQPATTQVEATTDYRYIGSSPNNYITFNNETWRIIGVFDGKIKIIKDESIGNMFFDYKEYGIGSSTSSTGSNDWVDSQLMYMLNSVDIATNVALKTGYTHDDTYVYDANGKIIYQKGCQPASTDGTSYSCTATPWTLTATALNQIADVTYYLGALNANGGLSVPDYYGFERGIRKWDDTYSTNWTGKVGLMYPSDYGYTFAYGVDSICYSDVSICNTENIAVPSASWLYNPSIFQWTYVPYITSNDFVFSVKSDGSVALLSPGGLFTRGVRPVVYLKSDILLSGSGTSDDKYEIVVPQQTGAEMLISKANDASVTTYSEGDTGEMYTFSQPETVQLEATTDYRYIGSSPNNYITFNNETWRIIGVFDGKIKIIKDTSIGDMRWDYKKSGVGSSTTDYGSNDWVDSQLMYMLNPNDIATNVALKTGYTFDGTHVKDANNKIIYQKGCQPAETNGESYTCTANTWVLNATALTQVADVTYYLGGGGYNSTTHYGTTPDIYTWERGVAKYNATRSTNWAGKVGLMYPSDYGYTFAYGVDNTCYSDASNCSGSNPSSSWLFKSVGEWPQAPYSSSDRTVFLVRSTGDVNSNYANSTYGVRPVVYLKSNIVLSGSGTSDDKYQIVSE